MGGGLSEHKMVVLQRHFRNHKVGLRRLYTDDFKAFQWERERSKL